MNHPYIEYILDINYDNKKKYQLQKQFHHFANLYNNLINLYEEYIQFPLSFSDIFENLNSNSFLNQNKTQVLEKFINEVAHTEILNSSKSFLKFIEYEKFLKKTTKLKNKSEKDDLIFKGNNFNDNKINNKKDNKNKIKENNNINNRYINMFNSDNKENISEKGKYNNINEE